jgi:hypothetical protein
MQLPFEQIQEGPDTVIRTFSSKIQEIELKWHWDEQDRVIIPMNDNDWYFQFDNELPIQLKPGTSIFIPQGKFHRVIKGTTDLVIRVEFH